MPSTESSQLQSELADLKNLKGKFDTAHTTAVAGGDPTEARQLKAELGKRLQALKEKLNPLESQLRIQEQYEHQLAVLETNDILETFADGEQGIRDIDGQEYPVPTLSEINRRIVERRELLKTKTEQGFAKLILVPFGLALDTLIEKYRAALQRHFDDKMLFYTKADPLDPKEKLVPITALHEEGPLYVWEEYRGADQAQSDPNTGHVQKPKLVYHPQEFSENHQGQTKQQLLDLNGGWKILLLENMPNIPKSGQAKTMGGRTQIDNAGNIIKKYMEKGQTTPNPMEYLAALQTESANPSSPYFEEQGLTPEDQISYAMTYLEAENQVIDDYQGQGRISWQIGAYFPASGYVPVAYWNRADRRAYLSGSARVSHNGFCGLRSAVGV